jgi:aspartate kinase
MKFPHIAEIVVMKFGGASLATTAALKQAARRVARRALTSQVVVIVSAMGDETDRLVGLGREITGKRFHPELDAILAAGEQVAAGLMALALIECGTPARSFLAHQLPLLTDGRFGDAQIVRTEVHSLLEALAAKVTPVVAGFQGIDMHQRLVTLGRGGSDTTAVSIAAALRADVCEFYKDVDGVYSSDPNVNQSARKLECITHEEMQAISEHSPQILHSKAVRLAAQYGVALHVRSAFAEIDGTRIIQAKTMEKVTG